MPLPQTDLREPRHEVGVDSPPEPTAPLGTRGGRLGARLRSARPVALGAVLALVAVAAVQSLLPRPPEITRDDVHAAIASALASATPPPALSEQAYSVIQPSLVLVVVRK